MPTESDYGRQIRENVAGLRALELRMAILEEQYKHRTELLEDIRADLKSTNDTAVKTRDRLLYGALLIVFAQIIASVATHIAFK